MEELYEKQEDGSFKPVEQPPRIVRKVTLYKWLKGQGLSLEEVRFLVGEWPNISD